MSRALLLAVGAAGLALVGVAPAQAASTAQAAATTTCGSPAIGNSLQARVCATVDGGTVSFTGTVAPAGVPAPTGLQLTGLLSAQVDGGASLGSLSQNAVFNGTTLQFGPLTATAPCGSTVQATFDVYSYGWGIRPVTVDVPVAC
ncbi:hypothetical protein ACFYNO_37255 [Kitasatospora sp. NPDC006697]|uniref:hypothetical protein n=1 Tax=Kitasatospora sp. NPDC006697 TaxID=3364020 RepID=UPI00368A33E4